LKASISARLKHLEGQHYRSQGAVALFRYGWLTPLPPSFLGDKHIEMVSSHPTRNPQIEWCEFEERPGPPSSSDDHRGPTIYLLREEIGPANDSACQS
jgi:hypothetical protein